AEAAAAAAGRGAAPEAALLAVGAGLDPPFDEVAVVLPLAVQAADFRRDRRRAEGVGVRVVGHGRLRELSAGDPRAPRPPASTPPAGSSSDELFLAGLEDAAGRDRPGGQDVEERAEADRNVGAAQA